MIHQPLTPPEDFETPGSTEGFYEEVVRLMAESEIPFLLSGTYALSCYTGIVRPTKDVDVFAKAGDALKMLSLGEGQKLARMKYFSLARWSMITWLE